jgi:hypothetical protein
MIIEIDTRVLVNEKLTPTQFFMLQLLMEGQYTALEEWYTAINNSSIIRELQQLIESEFLANLNISEDVDFKKFILLTKGIKLLGMDRDWFQELVDAYPIKTIRSDGIKDYLRTDLERCRKIYQKVTNGNLSKHENVLRCLEYELQTRKREDSMSYMKRLPKWLASEEWKSFEERILDESTTDIEHDYGTELV